MFGLEFDFTSVVAVAGPLLAVGVKLASSGFQKDVREAAAAAQAVRLEYDLAMTDGTMSQEETVAIAQKLSIAVKEIGDVAGYGAGIIAQLRKPRK